MAEARALAEGAVGLADLLACAEVMDDARLQRIAALMGLECRKPEPKDAKQEESGKSPVVEGGKNVATGDVRSDTAAAPAGEHRYFRVVRMRTIDADGDDTEPTRRIQYARAVEPLGDNPYLIPWSRTWPFLRVALGEDSERRELAIPHLVRRIARGETLRRLPRRHLRRWALRAHLLIDLDERLEPIRNEQYRIRDLLPMLRGHEGLEIFAFKRGPSGAIQRWDGQRWREETGPYRPPEAGTRVLIIGDLGRYAGEPLREDWLALGREFKLRGIDPMLLAPCPSRWWDSRWRDVFKPVTLDQGAQLPRRRDDPRPWMLGGGQNEAVKVHRDKHAKELLALLAPAVRITPALLRRLRWGLRPARGDIGSELAAWTHPELV
ncbi:MAG: hypothetical protein KDE45_23285, partial [Caldilineaceae bacterium]|nr:hypothetical protein [Caldilineaceae bacterium]